MRLEKIENISENEQKFTFYTNIFKDNIIAFSNVIGKKYFEFFVKYFDDAISINNHTFLVEKDKSYEFTYKLYPKTKRLKAIDGVSGLRKFLNDKYASNVFLQTIFETITQQQYN